VRLALTVSERYEIYGIPVYLGFKGETQEQLRSKISKGLAYLHEYDPRRLARAQRDLSGILVWPRILAGRATFDPESRMCMLDAESVLGKHAGLVSLSIAHEAMHARLNRFPYDTPERRARIERVCVKAEIALAERVPGGQRSVASLRAQLAAIRPESYTEGAWRRRIGRS